MYKELLPVVDFNIIVAISLIFLLVRFKNKFDIKNRLNRIYTYCIVVVISLIILEILDRVALLHIGEPFVIFTKIINVLGFGLSPVVAYLWCIYIFESFEIKVNSKIFIMPSVISGILSLISVKYGYIFSVSNINEYTRGDLFFIPMGVTLLYFLITLFIIKNHKVGIKKNEYKLLIIMEVIPLIAALIQIAFSELLILWGSVGVVLIMRYLFLQEDLLKYDELTGILNRRGFKNLFYDKYLNKNKPFSLIYVDINDFKVINDIYGHNEGDNALKIISSLLENTIGSNGEVARIGGDEFIAIINSNCEDELEYIITLIKDELYKLNNSKRQYKIYISLGYKNFNNKYLKLSNYIEEIDKLMYEDKEKNKNYI